MRLDWMGLSVDEIRLDATRLDATRSHRTSSFIEPIKEFNSLDLQLDHQTLFMSLLAGNGD